MIEFIISKLYYFIRKIGITIIFKRAELDTSSTNIEWFNNIFYRVLADDKERNDAYKKAIRRDINGESNVVEIGCGDRAFLSKLCLEQKPNSFLTIEENEQSFEKAKELLSKTCVNRTAVSVMKGNSNQVNIKDKGNVLVQEIIGSIASSEGLAQAIVDAKERLLEPASQFIPSACRTWVVPVSRPSLNVFEKVTALFTIGRFKQKCLYRIFNFPQRDILNSAKLFEEFEFAKEINLENHRKLVFQVGEKSCFNGFLFYLEVDFGEGIRLNSLKQITNWSTPYLQLSQKGVTLEKGDTIELEIETDLNGLNPKYKIKTSLKGKQLEEVIDFNWEGS